ncbi:MAG: hypothetical protein KME21_26435 [Desmonostoc vinosum HA7617-LM4]|nr:hypothetical protein [Desmonostoc vinosum HA7617-LM4]
MSSLGKKRIDAVLTIAAFSVGGAVASAVPTPGGEIPKQLLFTASDIIMYTKIWKIYFEEDLSSKGLMQILVELGFVTVAATGIAYVCSKANTAILKELMNWTGPLGWVAIAAISSSIGGLFALSWLLYCDRLYSDKNPQPV